MTSTNEITINASADDAWRVIGDDFVAVDKWMAANPTAEAIPGPALPGAPAHGRNSYLIKKFQPMYQEEIITAYDVAKREISTKVTMRNTPGFMPMEGYNATLSVKEIGPNRCTLTYSGYARPKWFVRPLKGALTKGLNPGFLRGLEELAHFIEKGEPHPRKIEKLETEALASA